MRAILMISPWGSFAFHSWWWSVIAVCLLGMATPAPVAMATETPKQVWKIAVVSDIHADLLYGTTRAKGPNPCQTPDASPYGQYGCDTPVGLLQSAAEGVAQTEPDVALVGGDWLRHDADRLSTSEVLQTYRTVADAMQNATRHVIAVPHYATALGNNDVVPDYHFDPNSPPPLLADMADILLSHAGLTAAERQSYRRGGFFRRRIPAANLSLFFLNTVVLSASATPRVAGDVVEQMASLRSALAEAETDGDGALLMGHIPPTIDLHNAFLANRPEGLVPYWFKLREEYRAVVRAYRTTIVAQFFAHTHRFTFSASLSVGSVPLFVFGAVSPIYGNNPNFAVLEYNATTRQLVSLVQHRLDIRSSVNNGSLASNDARWHPTSALFADGTLEDLSGDSLDRLATAAGVNQTIFERWSDLYDAGANTALEWTAFRRRLALCSLKYPDKTSLASCSESTTAASSPTPTPRGSATQKPVFVGLMVALVGVCLATVAAAVVVNVIRRRRRQLWQRALARGDAGHGEDDDEELDDLSKQEQRSGEGTRPFPVA